MKGTITRCLSEMIHERYAPSLWERVMDRAGIDEITRSSLRLPSANVADSAASALMVALAEEAGISMEEVYDQFGDYWCCVYVPKMYAPLLGRFRSAREMILGMDQVHVELTRSVPQAQPPRFDYRWEDDRTLKVHYRSFRNLIGLYVGLVRGVGKFFDEAVTVSKDSDTDVTIRFAAADQTGRDTTRATATNAA